MVVWLRSLPIYLLFVCARAEQYVNSYNVNSYANGDDDGNANGGNDDYYVYQNSNSNSNYDDAYSSSSSYNNGNSRYNNYYYADDQYNSNTAYTSELYSNMIYSQYGDNTGQEPQEAIIQNCKKPTIAVNSVTILCDSPYTYYYGNGAHRGSKVCDYGDMATVMVNFSVLSKIRTLDKAYMTIAIYAQKMSQELLFAAMNVDMADLVGKKVSRKGMYEFTMRVMLEKSSGDNSQFVPSFEFGFSTKQDEGYNLGGVNINCNYNVRTQPYSSKFYRAKQNSKNKFGAGPSLHFASFGFMLGVALLAGTFLFFYNKKRIAMEKQTEHDYDEDDNANSYVNAKDTENSIFK